MAEDNPAQGIINWEKNFWSLGGLLNKRSGKAAPKPDTSWHDAMVKKANESFRKTAEQKRGTTLKGTTSGAGKRRSKRKSTQRKPKQGK